MAKRTTAPAGNAPAPPFAQTFSQPPGAPGMPPAPMMPQAGGIAIPGVAPVVAQPAASAPIVPQQPPMIPAAGAPQQALAELEAATNAIQQGQQAYSQPQQTAGGSVVNLGVDLSNVSSRNYRTLDETLEYEAEVVECIGSKNNSGNDMLSIVLEVCHPPQYAGSCVNAYVNIGGTDNPWVFKSFADACGLLDPTKRVCIAQSPKDFEENVVAFRVRNEEYQKSLRSKIDGAFFPPSVTALA